ncbi:MAG: apolipoprotein N-acyltransferase [bacterium]
MKKKSAPADAVPPTGSGALARRVLESGWSRALLALAAGLMAGLAWPGGPAPWLWVIVYIPLFVALDALLRGDPRLRPKTWWHGLLLCWLTGVGHGLANGAWIVNTVHVYGHLPLPLAYGVTLFGYGSLLGLETFAFLGVPFLLGWHRPRWGFLLVLLWSAAFQGLVPRFLYWTFGHLIHPQPLLVQAADLVGSPGLNFFILSLHLAAFAWLRQAYAAPLVGRRQLVGATVAVALLFGAAAGYGWWRERGLALATEAGAPVNLGGVQPNFSLGQLASNPELSFSDRRRGINALLGDTARLLDKFEPSEEIPTVVVWPESVYPVPYFAAPRMREAVEWWARLRRIDLVLASVAQERVSTPQGMRLRSYGASIHLPAAGGPPNVYRKIALIPFGETIPFASWFPAYRRVLRGWIPNISEFEPGKEFTVFQVSPDIRLAPMICFDAVSDGVARGMRRNGANLGLVLANLAWFGKSNGSAMLEYSVRFRAIENRLPILMLSQNGSSVMIDAAGRAASARTPEFEPALLPLRVKVPRTYSFFSAHSGAVQGGYLAGVGLLLAWRFARPGTGGRGSRGKSPGNPGRAPARRR